MLIRQRGEHVVFISERGAEETGGRAEIESLASFLNRIGLLTPGNVAQIAMNPSVLAIVKDGKLMAIFLPDADRIG